VTERIAKSHVPAHLEGVKEVPDGEETLEPSIPSGGRENRDWAEAEDGHEVKFFAVKGLGTHYKTEYCPACPGTEGKVPWYTARRRAFKNLGLVRIFKSCRGGKTMYGKDRAGEVR